MQLTDDQVQQVRQWAGDGASLGEIQRRMDEQFDLSISFMETRFLLGDHGIQLREEEKETDAPPQSPDDSGLIGGEGGADLGGEGEIGGEGGDGGDLPGRPLGGMGSVSVTLDTIAQPGMMASGRATFSDGEGAAWYVDEFGRLGLNPDTPNYRPSEADLGTFQEELAKVAQKAGLG